MSALNDTLGNENEEQVPLHVSRTVICVSLRKGGARRGKGGGCGVISLCMDLKSVLQLFIFCRVLTCYVDS